jgi:hypothetical protein
LGCGGRERGWKEGRDGAGIPLSSETATLLLVRLFPRQPRVESTRTGPPPAAALDDMQDIERQENKMGLHVCVCLEAMEVGAGRFAAEIAG